MIESYTYCGKYKYGDRLWGVVRWAEDGYSSSYIFWGSPKNPIIKPYKTVWKGEDKRKRLAFRIKEKRESYSTYVEVPPEKIKDVYPELDSLISMHMLHKKLKCSNTND